MTLVQALAFSGAFLIMFVLSAGLMLVSCWAAMATLNRLYPRDEPVDRDIWLLTGAYMVLAAGLLILSSVALT